MPQQQAPDQWVEVSTVGVKRDFGEVGSRSTPMPPDAAQVPDDPEDTYFVGDDDRG